MPSFATRYGVVFLLNAVLMTWMGAPQGIWSIWGIQNDTGTAIGEISILDCKNHGQLSYSFVVDGVKYVGDSSAFQGACTDLKQGEAVKIYYENSNPVTNIAVFNDARQSTLPTMFYAHAIFLLIGFTIFPALFVFASYFMDWYYRKTRSPPLVPPQ